MNEDTSGLKEAKKIFSIWKILLPVAIGLAVVILMFLHDAKQENLRDIIESIVITPDLIFFLFLSFLFMFGRDFGLSWRFRALTDRELRWGQAFKVDFLCEFTSCVTPSAVGGSSLGMLFLNSQGIEIGRATTLMMTTLFLDELFFVISCPLVVLFTPARELFSADGSGFGHGIRLTFWIVYSLITIWTLILFIGILIRPGWIKSFFSRVFSLKWLRRWQGAMLNLADNMQQTSVDLKTKPMRFWGEVFGGTALSWLSRYLVVNALFMGFLPETWGEQWIILAKQFVLWVVLMVSPTPGGSGLSEYLFSGYYGNIVPSAGMALVLAICWRIISYYVYLVIGCIILPGWLKQTIHRFSKNKS